MGETERQVSAQEGFSARQKVTPPYESSNEEETIGLDESKVGGEKEGGLTAPGSLPELGVDGACR
jgi:hypothetical protein